MIRIENVTILKVMTFFCFRGICLLKQTASGAQSVASPSKIEGFREFEADLSALFIGKMSGIYETADSFCGSCARMIAPNIRTQPKISRLLKCCPRIIHPASTEIQDSRLRIREATVGFMFFWPTICRV